MADRVLFISWGAAVPGREERGLEVFNDALGICGRMQREGRIEKFDVVLLPYVLPNVHIESTVDLSEAREVQERLARYGQLSEASS